MRFTYRLNLPRAFAEKFSKIEPQIETWAQERGVRIGVGQHHTSLLFTTTEDGEAFLRALGPVWASHLKERTYPLSQRASGHIREVAPIIKDIMAGGFRRFDDIANELNRRGVRTERSMRWGVITVARVMARLQAESVLPK